MPFMSNFPTNVQRFYFFKGGFSLNRHLFSLMMIFLINLQFRRHKFWRPISLNGRKGIAEGYSLITTNQRALQTMD